MARLTKRNHGSSDQETPIAPQQNSESVLALPSTSPEDEDITELRPPPISIYCVRAPTPSSQIPHQIAEEWGPTNHMEKIFKLARFDPHCRACEMFQRYRARTVKAVDDISNEAKHPSSSKLQLPSFIRHRWTRDDTMVFRFFHRIQMSMDDALREGTMNHDFVEYRQLERTLANFKEDELNKRISNVLSVEAEWWIRREKWERVKAKARGAVEVVKDVLKGKREERVMLSGN